MVKKCEVGLTRRAEKALEKMPTSIQDSLLLWIETIRRFGVCETRKIKGYHDEPLHEDRKGQRSVRLNKAYRAIYVLKETIDVEIIQVIEIHKHRY